MSQTFTRDQIIAVHNEIALILKQDYFDLRLELADHMLNDIAQQRTDDPNFSFYLSLNKAVESLGGKKGIQKISFSRKYELWKQYLSNHLRAFMYAISWPHILISAVVIGLIYNFLGYIDNYLWVFLIACLTTGFIETIDRWGTRGWINDFGSTLTIFPIYSRSAFLTNSPLLLLMMVTIKFPNSLSQSFPVLAQIIGTFGLFMYLVFFIFRFYQLRKGVREEIKRYRQINQQILGVI